MSDFLKIAERCEREPEGDDALNCDIGVAIGHFAARPNRNYLNRIDYVDLRQQGREIWPGHGGDQLVPNYTGSIDGAMALRPDGWSYQLKTAAHHENGFQFECWVSWGPESYQRINSQAPTEALAICAGWLRARARDDVGTPPESSK